MMMMTVMMTTMMMMLNMTTVAKSIIKNTEDVAPTHHATCRDDECPVKNATLILNTDLWSKVELLKNYMQTTNCLKQAAKINWNGDIFVYDSIERGGILSKKIISSKSFTLNSLINSPLPQSQLCFYFLWFFISSLVSLFPLHQDVLPSQDTFQNVHIYCSFGRSLFSTW